MKEALFSWFTFAPAGRTSICNRRKGFSKMESCGMVSFQVFFFFWFLLRVERRMYYVKSNVNKEVRKPESIHSKQIKHPRKLMQEENVLKGSERAGVG